MVEDEVLRRGVIRKRLPQLLDYPRRNRIECGIEVQDMPATVLDHEESIQEPERHRGDGEEIHGRDGVHMLSPEGNPTLQLVGISGMPSHVS
ncbi:MAG: hypothetical protein QNK18_07930 [Gammaproteobacteria bacterium]|nr:hypothetical protein [Gammaproteobacteria bacterium]MDJ0891107.1 hypothetical protein [Gammaproteobacteria bacterium]